MKLVIPSGEYLPSYVAALERGWSADTVRGEAAIREELEAIARDAMDFLDALQNPRVGGLVTLPDGSQAQRLPGYRRWIWDGDFCGSINLRWEHGTTDLPPHMLGHVGYAVVPWKQGHGYATEALRLILEDARREGLPWVTVTTDETNIASQKVIEANGGELVERFDKPPMYGGQASRRYRIKL